jgi:hypothetical protein
MRKATTTVSGGSIESSLVSTASSLAYNGGNNVQKDIAAYAMEGILGAIAAVLL